MSQPADFTAYDWDPVTNSYVPSVSAARGRGTWIIMNPTTHPTEEVRPYIGSNSPPDLFTGAPDIQLKAGWNIIGDPYQYAIPVAHLVGISASNPAQSFTFASLVAQGVVSPYLAYWDPLTNNYRYVQGIDAVMQPNRGYWIKVLTSQDLTLNFPPVYDTFVPDSTWPPTGRPLPSGRAVAGVGGWTQSPDHWRLHIQARSPKGGDPENYVGVSTASGSARLLANPEPPKVRRRT